MRFICFFLIGLFWGSHSQSCPQLQGHYSCLSKDNAKFFEIDLFQYFDGQDTWYSINTSFLFKPKDNKVLTPANGQIFGDPPYFKYRSQCEDQSLHIQIEILQKNTKVVMWTQVQKKEEHLVIKTNQRTTEKGIAKQTTNKSLNCYTGIYF